MIETGMPYRVGDYRLVKRLGVGGMGQVYLGYSPSGLPVAVKLVHHDLAGDGAFRARFAREVAAARAVSGAFTAPVLDADPGGEPPWLVTLFLPGLSLQDAIASYGPMPPPAVVALGAGLAEALRSIHEAGVVHRDLKPSNIMLCPDPEGHRLRHRAHRGGRGHHPHRSRGRHSRLHVARAGRRE